MYKEIKVVMISTQKIERLYKDNGILYFDDKPSEFSDFKHLYFLSDDEIKEGDWYYNNLFNATSQLVKEGLVDDDVIETLNKNCHNNKIIASTDTSLGLPQPSEEWIEYFISEWNAGRRIDFVLVEYEEKIRNKFGEIVDFYIYKEDKSTEVLKVNQDNTINIKPIKDSFSREEVIENIQENL